MVEPAFKPSLTANLSAEIHPVQAILRFFRAVRYRKAIVIVSAAVSILLGGLYYFTTDRVFRSGASLLILPTGTNRWTTEMPAERQTQNLMATYRTMLSSEVVLEAAAKLLPSEYRTDAEDRSGPRRGKILRDHLEVGSVRDANVLTVAYRSTDPQIAKAVVDSILSAYLAFTHELHKNTAGELLDILTNEQHNLEEQLDAKKAELLELRSQAGEVVLKDAKDGVHVAIKRAISLNASLIKAHEERLEAQSKLVAVETAVRNGADLQQYAVAILDSVGEEMLRQRLGMSSTDAYTVSRINQQLLEDRAQWQTAMQFYGPESHKVRELGQRIQVAEQYLRDRHELDGAQRQEISNAQLAPLLLQTAQQQFQQAVAHENAIRVSYEEEKTRAIGMDRTTAQLDILELDLQRLRAFYDVVLQRLADIDLSQDSGMLRTEILDHPEAASAPIWPRKAPVFFLALVLGIGSGLAIVYLQELLDDHFRSPEELQSHLGLPVLAIVPRLELFADRGIEAVAVHMKPNVPEVEAFRTLRTALALAENGVQRVVVSSSEPGDGKTTVVANLAAVYAQSGKRTLLIDADMRRPGLTPLLDLRGEKGLSTLLRQDAPIAEAVEANARFSLIENLDVLPAGPRPTNPTELLTGERFSDFLAWAEIHYDQVLIDSPPALVSDTAIIGRLVDGVLLVIQPEKNRRREVVRAAEGFPALGVKVLGIVVNHLASENDKTYYGYGYGYGHGYGYGYGHDEDAPEGENDPDLLAHPSRKTGQEAA